MFESFAVCLVDFCRRRALWVALAFLIASLGGGFYIASHFKINTDIDQLLADDLPWRVKEREMAAAFPHTLNRLVIVVDGANPDLAEDAATRLTAKLALQKDLFKTVVRPELDPTFQTYGLLFLSEDKLGEVLDVLIKAQPFLGSLAADPSARGLFSTLSLAAQGVARGDAAYDSVGPSLGLFARTLDAQVKGEATVMPWQSLMAGSEPSLRDLRKFILTQPVLDYSALEPGQRARKAVREAAAELGFSGPSSGVSVRMTGPVALNDEEFASVSEGMGFAMLLSLALVLGVLYLALRSARLIYPILITLLAGLIATTAFALVAVGTLNLISVAFAVMFVGIAVDFGIQVGVRYRACRYECGESDEALRRAAHTIARPLAMAALMTAAGFLAFVPTDYRGVSELGIIASAGMVIAFLFNLTLLPALLALAKPRAEKEPIGYGWMAPADAFLEKHRGKLLLFWGILALGAGGLALQVRFDFDPLNLKNPRVESVSTLFDIMKDPQASPYVIEILAPSLDKAREMAAKIDALPEVSHSMTLASFVPERQEDKLALIADANLILGETLAPAQTKPAPNAGEIRAAMEGTAQKLRALGQERKEAQELAAALEVASLVQDPAFFAKLDEALIGGMRSYLERVRLLLAAQPVALEGLSPSLRASWIAQDGRAKIEVYLKGDGRDPKVLTAFTQAVQKIAPEAIGAPIAIQESGKTIVAAFTRAGGLTLLVVTALSWLLIRRKTVVFKLVASLILSLLLTLATLVLIRLPLNFANIIALPLLLSLGVSYAVYFVNDWLCGHDKPLQSSMARAVLFSAATTLVAFGSLSLSSHPGTSGMGELLTLALLYSVLSTFFALPVLLGKPASDKDKPMGDSVLASPFHKD